MKTFYNLLCVFSTFLLECNCSLAHHFSNQSIRTVSETSNYVQVHSPAEGDSQIEFTSVYDIIPMQLSLELKTIRTLNSRTSTFVLAPKSVNCISIAVQSAVACASYMWPVNNTTYSTSGVYSDTLVGAAIGGCDSVITLHLTISPPVTILTVLQSVCNETAQATYDTLRNQFGCDSIITHVVQNAFIIDTTLQIKGDTLIAALGFPAFLYQWKDCTTGLPISGAVSDTFVPSVSGSYKVTISDTFHHCAVNSECKTITLDGLPTLTSSAFQLVPNPTTGTINITYNGTCLHCELRLYDLLGRILLKQDLKNGASSMDLQNFESGTYILELRNNEQVMHKKLVKQ